MSFQLKLMNLVMPAMKSDKLYEYVICNGSKRQPTNNMHMSKDKTFNGGEMRPEGRHTRFLYKTVHVDNTRTKQSIFLWCNTYTLFRVCYKTAHTQENVHQL